MQIAVPGCPRLLPAAGTYAALNVEIVLETATPEGIRVVLPALVYAKILEQHSAVADLDMIDRLSVPQTSAVLIQDRVVSASYTGRMTCSSWP